MDDMHIFRDGMPIELRITLLYITAAIVLTGVIVVANYDAQREVEDSINAIKAHVDTLTEACYVAHPKLP